MSVWGFVSQSPPPLAKPLLKHGVIFERPLFYSINVNTVFDKNKLRNYVNILMPIDLSKSIYYVQTRDFCHSNTCRKIYGTRNIIRHKINIENFPFNTLYVAYGVRNSIIFIFYLKINTEQKYTHTHSFNRNRRFFQKHFSNYFSLVQVETTWVQNQFYC